MAIDRRGVPAGLLWHSDRGVQYADALTRALAKEHGMQCSMSRKGNCWDNAVVESFWASLKSELFHDYTPATREEARAMIFEWIEIWYNRQRLHSTLGYVTPEQFELKTVGNPLSAKPGQLQLGSCIAEVNAVFPKIGDALARIPDNVIHMIYAPSERLSSGS